MNVLYYEKEAWKGLGEMTKAIAVAEGQALAMAQAETEGVPAHDRVAALLEVVASTQITQQDFHAAIRTAFARASMARPRLRGTYRG